MQFWCLGLMMLLFLSALPAAAGWGRAQLDTGTALCADTLRLHIRADSDTLQDQTDKLAVRDAVLAYMDTRCRAATQPEALRWAAAHLPELEWTARRTLALRGSRADVTVKLVEMYFDTTRYGSRALPAGRYQALRIDLGDAARHGRNWWCVLYPSLCFADALEPAMTEEGEEKLQQVLDEDAYDLLLHPQKLKIRFRLEFFLRNR